MKNAIKKLSIATLALVALNASAASNSNSTADIKPLSVIEKEVSELIESREFQNISSIKDASIPLLAMQLSELKLVNKKMDEQIRAQREQLIVETITMKRVSEIKNILHNMERRG